MQQPMESLETGVLIYRSELARSEAAVQVMCAMTCRTAEVYINI
uniref:Uncharacterized protein n=1 Tax=Arundo donax TaxID=35708 RepID=A0A0A8ZBX0_ARUDO